MRRLTTILLALGTLAGCAGQGAASRDDPAAEVLLVSGGWVVTMDAAGTVIENGAVAIAGERIAAVGPAAELAARYGDAEALDAAGKVVMPGLVNSHTHVPMTLFRGLADDLALMDWLEKVIFLPPSCTR